MAAATQSMESMSLADQQQGHSARHKRPARAYHDFYSQQQQQQQQLPYPQQPYGAGVGITPTGSPFSGDARNSPAPFAPIVPAFSPYENHLAATSQTHLPSAPLQQQQFPGQNLGFGGPVQGNSPQSQLWRGTEQDDLNSQGSVVLSGTDGIPRISTERLIADQKVAANPFFKTFENACPPGAGTDYSIIDQGLAGPQYVRLSMYNVPNTELIRSSTKLPLGIVLRPFAPFSNLEYECGGVPISDFSAEIPPPRCSRCRAYMNPSMIFTQGGSHFVCNMCQFSNPVSAEYFQPTDNSGRRIDWHLRPELAFGTYDIAVPKEYQKFPEDEQTPLRYLFLIDVTHENVKRGIHSVAIEALRSCLYGPGVDPGDEAREAYERSGNTDPSPSRPINFPKGAQVAIATFDRSIQFYNLSHRLEQPQAIVMSDLDDPFIPLEDGLFVDPEESRSVIESLFGSIDSMFEGNRVDNPVFGAVLEVAYKALERTGGKVSVVLGSLPSYGPGTVALREKSGGFTGEREKELFAADNKFYKDLGKKYATSGIGLDLFLFPQALIELSNIGHVCQASGGHEFLYPRYIPERDGRQFIADFCKTNQGEIGTQVSLKVRCSTGLQVFAYYGNFHREEWASDPNIGSVDANSTFAVLFNYDGKLEAKLDAHFQSAMLYTASNGQRRVRINNIVSAITTTAKSTTNFADTDASVGIIVRDNLSRMPEYPLKELRLRMNDRLIDVFTAYRQKANSSLSSSQLLMPLTLRTLIPYLLSVQKSRPFRDQSLTADSRVHFARLMNTMSVDQLSVFLYPRIMGLHNLRDEDCIYNDTGRFTLPINIPASTDSIDEGGVYIVYNGISILLWLHRQVSPALLRDLFGEYVDSLENLNPNLNELPEIDTDVSVKARRLVQYFTNKSGISFLGITIARQGIDGSDYEMQFSMVEDPGTETLKYRDYVSLIHNSVKNKLEHKKEKSAMSFISENLPFGTGH